MSRSGFCIALLLTVLWTSPALAYSRDCPSYRADRAMVYDGRDTSRWELKELAGELKAQDTAAWTIPQLERYYNKAVEYLYWHLAVGALGSQVDYTLETLRFSERNNLWPGDPLNNWEPLPIQDIDDDPLPGGIVLQVCPAERYGDPFHHGWPSARSFEVSIYAPAGLTPRRVRPRAGNRGWAVVRPEMLAMRGWFSPPYTLIDDPGYDPAEARLNSEESQQLRARVTAWFHEHYPEPSGGLNVRGDFGLDRMSSVFQLETKCAGLEEQYTGVPPEEWAPKDLETWLHSELFIVYSACLACEYLEGSERQLDYDLAALHRDGFITRIPPNLFAEGRPLRILTPEEGFSPGDLCLMYPTSYWAGTNSFRLGPRMHQLFIYGREPDAEIEQALAEQMNFKDGTYYVPPGARQATYTYTNGYLLNMDLKQVNCESCGSPEPVDSAGNPAVPVTTSVRLRDKAEEELRAKDPAEWTEAEVDRYLGYALWSYFGAVEIYKEIMECPADDPQWLVDVGYLKTWPLNPFDNWRPVRLLTPADGFSAGDIVFQPDPDGNGGYELGIYGPTPETELAEWCRPYVGHEEWTEILPGVRYLVGAPPERLSVVSKKAFGR